MAGLGGQEWPPQIVCVECVTADLGRTDRPVEFEEMQPEEIRQVLLDILSRIVPDEDLSGLRDEAPFREQIELDSMDFLDIVMELRKQYRVQIPEDDYPHLATMGGAVKYLTPLMKDVKAHA